MAINTITGNTLLQSGFFPPVRVASTGSPLIPSTGGLLVVDGVQLVAGDRVLCKDETSAVNNGIYAANTGPWVRTGDASNNQQFFSGMAVVCALGTANAKKIFICTCTDDPVIVGTSLITFASQLPIGAGNVVGPGSSTAGDVATYADGTGEVLADTAVTGSGSVVKATSPTLTTPNLGVATATSVNNVAITQPASEATLTLGSGKTVAISNSLTIAGTDGKTLTVSNSLTLAGTDGKTLTVSNSIRLIGTDNTQFTFPGSNDTVVGETATQTLANKTLTTPVIGTISGNTAVTGTITSGANGGTGGELTLNGSSSGSAVIGVSSTGSPEYGGTATNDNAAAGNIGEYLVSNCPGPSNTATVTITIASPAVITWTAHPFSGTAPHADVAPVVFTTSSSLPSGLTAGTTYYVIPSSITTNTFEVATTVANAIAGTPVNTSGSQSGTQTATAGSGLATDTPSDVTGLSLTAGDWDVDAQVITVPAASTEVGLLFCSLGTTAATINVTAGFLAWTTGFGTAVNQSMSQEIMPARFSLSGTTTIHLVVENVFSVSTEVAYGILRARRVR